MMHLQCNYFVLVDSIPAVAVGVLVVAGLPHSNPLMRFSGPASPRPGRLSAGRSRSAPRRPGPRCPWRPNPGPAKQASQPAKQVRSSTELGALAGNVRIEVRRSVALSMYLKASWWP